MPYFIKHFQMSDEDNDICASNDKARFDRAAEKALGRKVFEKRSFHARFIYVRQTANDMPHEIDR